MTKQQIIESLSEQQRKDKESIQSLNGKIRELERTIQDKNGDISRFNARSEESLRTFEIKCKGISTLLLTIESWHCNHTQRKTIEEFCAHSLNKIFDDFQQSYPGHLSLNKINNENIQDIF